MQKIIEYFEDLHEGRIAVDTCNFDDIRGKIFGEQLLKSEGEFELQNSHMIIMRLEMIKKK